MCKCKAFEQAKEHGMLAGSHKSVITDFVCLMCGSEKKRYNSHANDQDYFGYSFECAKCCSFIRYTNNDAKTVYKDEFYYEDFLVIQEEHQIQVVKYGSNKSAYLPRIEFQARNSFYNKIKTYLVFQ